MKNTLFLVAVSVFALMAFTNPESGKAVAKTAVKSVSSGIRFEHLTLAKAIKQAKSSGKLIFIDVHTTWCGPCKEMARTTFESDEVGRVFNKKFINLKIDAENDEDGEEVLRKYNVTVYPTLLFVDEDGRAVKKLIGKQSEEKLLSIANGL